MNSKKQKQIIHNNPIRKKVKLTTPKQPQQNFKIIQVFGSPGVGKTTIVDKLNLLDNIKAIDTDNCFKEGTCSAVKVKDQITTNCKRLIKRYRKDTENTIDYLFIVGTAGYITEMGLYVYICDEAYKYCYLDVPFKICNERAIQRCIDEWNKDEDGYSNDDLEQYKCEIGKWKFYRNRLEGQLDEMGKVLIDIKPSGGNENFISVENVLEASRI